MKFKYNISINQEAVISLGLDLDIIDLAIFDCIAGMLNSARFPYVTIPSEGRIFKWISTKAILSDLPLLKIGEKAVKTRVDKLVNCGLLIKYIWKEDGNKPYYTQGELFDSVFYKSWNENEWVGISTTKLGIQNGQGVGISTTKLGIQNGQGVGISTTNNHITSNQLTNNSTGNHFTNDMGVCDENHSTHADTRYRFSKENGLTTKNLNVRQSTIDKIDAAFEQLVFPIDDAEIKKLYFVLCCSPKWRDKTIHALQMSLNKLQNYDRDFTIKLIEDSIAGGWQGLVFENTDRKYQDYLKAKKGGISWGGGTTFTKMSDEERKEALEYLNL